MDDAGKQGRPVRDVFMRLINGGGKLSDQRRDIRQIAVRQRWGTNEISEGLRIAEATASRSPDLCQHLLILLVAAGEASRGHKLAGPVAAEAGEHLWLVQSGE